MSDFEQIPEIAERIKRSKMELQDNGNYWAPEWDSQSCCDQDFVNNFKKGWLSQQAIIDDLKAQLSLQRDRNKALETELTSSRNYGDKLNERIRKVSWLLGNNSFERTIKNCLKILRGEHEQ